MMNKILSILLTLMSFTHLGCGQIGPEVTLDIHVQDDQKNPLESVELVAVFRPGNKGVVHEEITPPNGFVSFTDKSLNSVSVFAEKDGFYDSQLDKIDISERHQLPRTRSINLTLREKMNPTALYAKQSISDRHAYVLPAQNEWIGFDLEKGDWVDPHGKGLNQDLLFRFSNEFLGLSISERGLETVKARRAKTGQPWTEEMERNTYGDWLGNLEIAFPREDEGILPVTELNGYLWESKMRMPHLAPDQGYMGSIAWNDVRNGKIMKRNGDGYFLRLRVKKRGDEIIEANYAKINAEIIFDPRGTLRFTYYFNPTINDQNLEFNLEENLFDDLPSREQVKLP